VHLHMLQALTQKQILPISGRVTTQRKPVKQSKDTFYDAYVPRTITSVAWNRSECELTGAARR